MAMSSLMEENPRDFRDAGEDILSNIGRQVLELLSRGGNKIREFDDAYAAKVREAVMPSNPDGSMMSVGRNMVGATIGAPLTHGLSDVSQDPRMINQVLKYAVPATSAGVRYGLPAAGAVGLAELTGNLYDYASDQTIA